MKCCKCTKEINIDKNDIPPQWFGMYAGGKIIKAICIECYKLIKDTKWTD